MTSNQEQLFLKHKVSSLVSDILLSQDLSDEEISQILEDQKYDLVSDDLDNIINRLFKAKAMNEKVVIVGDYDADGIMATSILFKAFERFGLEVGFYIPDRLKEGYGLNETIVETVSSKGYDLIVTVDNGVVAFDALQRAKELELEVIVTDHHHLEDRHQFDYDYLLHPKHLSNGYHDLCGAGLALIIAEKLLNKENMGEFYMYAMVATIADMVSVFGFNRNIIKNGLYCLNTFRNKHLEALIHYRNGRIDQQIISFQIVPKLNTFGRLADKVNVNNMVRYFLLDDEAEIEEVSKSIGKLNQERIDMTRNAFENSKSIKKYGSLNILIDEDIHEGITGLIAGKHLKELLEPTLVLTKVNGLYKGSGRSPKGYDIHKLLSPLEAHFESFGGHAQACGISFKEENLAMILKLVEETSKDLSLEHEEDPYLTIKLNDLSLESVKDFQKLEPYGVDFIKPKLKVCVENLQTPTILKEKYLKWTLNNHMDLLCFNAKLDLDHYKSVKTVEAFVDLSINRFRNKETINLVISDFVE